jgi:hypothetical protein
MGRVYTAKGHEADPSVVVPTSDAGPPRQTARSEICVVDEDALFDAVFPNPQDRVGDCGNINMELLRRFMSAIRPYLATREPVIVSLEKCAEGVLVRAKLMGIKLATSHGGSRDNAWQFTKAVLEAAGVKYHED